jgi:glycogen(starch) synthase
MRILHLSWEYPPVVHGGLGRHVHALAEAQAAAGHDVVVITAHPGESPYDEVRSGVRVLRAIADPPEVPFDLDHLLPWVMSLEHAMTRVGALLSREWQADVVHGHDWLVAHAGATLKATFDAPLVATIHATEAGRHQGWLPGPLSRAIHSVEWWLTFEARRVVVCSEHMRWEVQTLFDPPPESIDVIPNGIDLSYWSVGGMAAARARARWQPDPSAPLVVFSGRLEWEKGVHTLLTAVPALRRRFPGIRLVVAGQGAQSDALATQAAQARLGRAVTFAGFLPEEDLAALVAAADLAVIPSLYEPFGLVALEAAALGTPLAVSRTGGLAELVDDGVTGRTFIPGDRHDIADTVTASLRDPQAARRMAAAARRRAQTAHRWSAIAASTEAVYQRAVREERALQAGLAARADRPLRVVREGNLFRDRAAT